MRLAKGFTVAVAWNHLPLEDRTSFPETGEFLNLQVERLALLTAIEP